MIPPIQQEPDRVPRGLVRVSAVAVAVAIAASVGAVLLLGRGGLGEMGRVDSRPPENLDVELFQLEAPGERMRRLGDDRLGRYGWVDRARGLVHVPLDVAIELYLQERAP